MFQDVPSFNTAFFQHSGMILSDLDNIGTKEDGIEQLKNGGGGKWGRKRERETGERSGICRS